MTIATEFGERGGILAERNLKYVLIAPAVFIILFIGLYPVLHSLVVSFQDVSVLMKNYDFVGFMNYSRLFEDERLWYLGRMESILCWRGAVGSFVADSREILSYLRLSRPPQFSALPLVPQGHWIRQWGRWSRSITRGLTL